MDAQARLVAGLQSGEDWAPAEFWDRFWPDIYAICARILGNGPDATDTAVDVLTDFMVDYVHRLSSPEALWSYLRLMAARRSVRLREHREKMVCLKEDQLVDSHDLSQEDAAECAILMPRLNACLKELTPKAQQAIRLRYGKQMTNQRIGALLGGSKQYIGRLLTKSLKLLRICLEANRHQPQTSV